MRVQLHKTPPSAFWEPHFLKILRANWSSCFKRSHQDTVNGSLFIRDTPLHLFRPKQGARKICTSICVHIFSHTICEGCHHRHIYKGKVKAEEPKTFCEIAPLCSVWSHRVKGAGRDPNCQGEQDVWFWNANILSFGWNLQRVISVFDLVFNSIQRQHLTHFKGQERIKNLMICCPMSILVKQSSRAILFWLKILKKKDCSMPTLVKAEGQPYSLSWASHIVGRDLESLP